MSGVSNTFLELVKRRYQQIESGTPAGDGNRRYFCSVCGKDTLHETLPDEGVYEVYQCQTCRVIIKIAVR